MRSFCIIGVLLVSTILQAQDGVDSAIQLKELSREGLLLDRGWKYKMADDQSFGLLSMDDADWKPINPALDLFDSIPPETKSGIGWLRLKVNVSPGIRNRTVGLLVQQSGASEIYLNGDLIGRYGNVSIHSSEVKTYDPRWAVLPVHFNNDSLQLLAVRYVLKQNQRYTTIFETSNPLIVLRAYTYADASKIYAGLLSKTHAFEFVLVGLCLMLLIIHLSLYVLYPLQKANLYFALFAIAYLVAACAQTFYYLDAHSANAKFLSGNLTFLLFMVCDIFILFSIMTFLEQKTDLFFKAVIVFFPMALFFNVYFYDWGWRVGGVLFKLLTQLIILRIAVRASKHNQRGARVFAFGEVATVVLFFTFILQGTFFQNDWLESLPIIRMVNYLLYQLCVPIAVSIFLASDFAFTTRRLQQKLEEVNQLSEKNLAIEKEKQEILSTQNIRLENLVDARTSELKHSLEELKNTQNQLVQSEKMASLGELTAGIAHEIQNPLNFVNNFSEVNRELIQELKQERNNEQGTRNEDRENEILNDIEANEEKINHHGKRADAIVKGMLQHSRTSTGHKEPTDINALCDEYLRLAYYGLRAKDKDFKATIQTDFDATIGKINVVPQDIGRVLLNLYNNAFYAVNERLRRQEASYTPQVIVRTKGLSDKVEIRVKDNGNGIPQNLVDKIFQPFFTTKPTGQGTGLGLSLAYDIVKAHGGEIKVEAKEGEGSEFVIQLPVTSTTA